MPKKGTKAYRDEITQIYWGINYTTKKVESVSRHRDGSLSKLGEDMRYTKHAVGPGKRIEAELLIVFGLSDTFSALSQDYDAPWVEKQKAELKAKIIKEGES